ncbi:MAG: biotin transporter BioY [Pseudomonadota bacterium]
MASPHTQTVPGARLLIDAWAPGDGSLSAGGLWLRRLAIVALGIAAIAIAAKIRVPFWPVPMTMQTFVILSLGAACGPRLALGTILGYLTIGALGFDVFTSSSADNNGIAYMLGGTGGYLLGYVLAVVALGLLAERGWDRSPWSLLGAMLIGQVLIFAPGLLWLGHLYAETKGWAWTVEVGLTPFLLGEVLKMALAMLLFPMLWRSVGKARG